MKRFYVLKLFSRNVVTFDVKSENFILHRRRGGTRSYEGNKLGERVFQFTFLLWQKKEQKMQKQVRLKRRVGSIQIAQSFGGLLLPNLIRFSFQCLEIQTTTFPAIFHSSNYSIRCGEMGEALSDKLTSPLPRPANSTIIHVMIVLPSCGRVKQIPP